MKTLALLVLAIATLALVGCSTGDVSADAAKKSYDEQQAKAEKLAAEGKEKFDSSD
ncbi:MAG: hypothetical protein K8H99_11735 [Nitrospirae bacterium]|nr:hypothetical protein [Fimbriimonadaceae bacterium]